MIEIQRQQCLEEAQLENETTGESDGNRGVPSSPVSPARPKHAPSITIGQMGIEGKDLTTELWVREVTQQKGHDAPMLPDPTQV